MNYNPEPSLLESECDDSDRDEDYTPCDNENHATSESELDAAEMDVEPDAEVIGVELAADANNVSLCFCSFPQSELAMKTNV